MLGGGGRPPFMKMSITPVNWLESRRKTTFSFSSFSTPPIHHLLGSTMQYSTASIFVSLLKRARSSSLLCSVLRRCTKHVHFSIKENTFTSKASHLFCSSIESKPIKMAVPGIISLIRSGTSPKRADGKNKKQKQVKKEVVRLWKKAFVHRKK